MGAWEKVQGAYDRLVVFGNREPILTVRRVLWLVTGGFWLAILYGVGAIIMLSTVVFLPFALQVLGRLVPFAMDGGITLEPYVQQMSFYPTAGFWDNPAHPYTIAANIAWALLFGWALVLAHVTAAFVHALTIIGVPTAITNIEMAAYVIWPFGRSIQRRELPTTLGDLYLSRLPPMPPTPTTAWV